MIPALAPLLKSRLAGYVIGGILAASVAGVMWLQLAAAEREVAQTKAEMAELVAGYAEASQIRQKHALRLVQEARAEEIAAGEARVQAEREAAERLREAATAAQRQAGEWRARLREAEASDPGCEAWLKAPVRCPVE